MKSISLFFALTLSTSLFAQDELNSQATLSAFGELLYGLDEIMQADDWDDRLGDFRGYVLHMDHTIGIERTIDENHTATVTIRGFNTSRRGHDGGIAGFGTLTLTRDGSTVKTEFVMDKGLGQNEGVVESFEQANTATAQAVDIFLRSYISFVDDHEEQEWAKLKEHHDHGGQVVGINLQKDDEKKSVSVAIRRHYWVGFKLPNDLLAERIVTKPGTFGMPTQYAYDLSFYPDL